MMQNLLLAMQELQEGLQFQKKGHSEEVSALQASLARAVVRT
jgi:hypothetical protein